MKSAPEDAQALEQLLRSRLHDESEDAGLPGPEVLTKARQLRDEFTRMFMYYEFAIAEVSTKVDILRMEFERAHEYSPIEHVRSRLKSPDSLLSKARRRELDFTVPAIRAGLLDIAGIRISCSFVSDVYWIAEMLSKQPDLEVLETKDYIAAPKPNGYRSLHLIVQVPVFLSNQTEHVPVELQIRTIAMDFWASMEHKLSYKYENRAKIPPALVSEIENAAAAAAELDDRVGRLRDEIRPDTHGRP